MFVGGTAFGWEPSFDQRVDLILKQEVEHLLIERPVVLLDRLVVSPDEDDDAEDVDEDGDLWYRGRADDMFKAAGYRIGPSEIENCLVRHEAVANAAVVPSPDEERGNIVKAYVVLAPGRSPSAALEDDIRQHVRGKLAPYEYPREIEFVDALPMTTTGKVQRKVLREREAARKAR